MKYFLLKEITEFLDKKANKIRFIKRVDNNTIIIEFNNQDFFYFNMTRGQSNIYKKEELKKAKKDFNAPFDILLQKRFNNSQVQSVELYNDDKIINIKVSSSSSYKKLITILQLEFTGKHTNIIILDENRIILEALRHIDEYSSSRVVKVGIKLEEIPKQSFIPKKQSLYNFGNIEKYLYQVYKDIEYKNIESVKKQKLVQISKKLQKLEKSLSLLPKKEDLEYESRKLYEKANLILNNLHEIKPYAKYFIATDFSNKEVKVELNTQKSASSYSDELFKKAKRAKHKANKIKIEKNNLEEKAEFLRRLIKNLEDATSLDEMEFLYPKKQKNQVQRKKVQNYESFFFEGYKIMLGTNLRENIYLLGNSKASDFWFHLKNRPSSHVIVQNTKKSLPPRVIKKAALLCAKFSTDFTGNYEVDYTQRRNVKIQNAANVLYNPYATISITT